MGEALIWGLFVFIVVFLINFLWIFKRGYENIKKQKSKKKNKKLEEFVGLSYLIPKFKLDINKMDLNYVFFMVSLIDAFIISFVFVVITIIPWDMGFSMLLGFVLLFGLIYALYEILGRVLVKKGWSKNES
jgi:ABC-type multidrug transport system fused ATPase/permease subunit